MICFAILKNVAPGAPMAELHMGELRASDDVPVVSAEEAMTSLAAITQRVCAAKRTAPEQQDAIVLVIGQQLGRDAGGRRPARVVVGVDRAG